MDLNSKNTNELECVRADLLVGTNPSLSETYSSREKDRIGYINRFIRWMFIYDECKKKFREEHTLIWNDLYQTNKNLNWLEYYKAVLIKEIRDIKLKIII